MKIKIREKTKNVSEEDTGKKEVKLSGTVPLPDPVKIRQELELIWCKAGHNIENAILTIVYYVN